MSSSCLTIFIYVFFLAQPFGDLFAGVKSVISKDAGLGAYFNEVKCLENLSSDVLLARYKRPWTNTELSSQGAFYTSEIHKSFKNLLPFESESDLQQRDGYLNRYVRIEPSQAIGAANYGIIAHNQEMLSEDNCLGKISRHFYEKLSVLDNNKRLKTRPAISDSSPTTDVWKLALSLVGNNEQLALKMIGICGHDDVNNGHGKVDRERNFIFYNINSTHLNSSLRNTALACQQDQQKCLAATAGSLVAEIKSATAPGSDCVKKEDCLRIFSELTTELNSLIRGTENREKGRPGQGISLEGFFRCPTRLSNMFMPGQFPFDISQETKNRIILSQSNDIVYKSSEPPAKYYHQIGGASLTCQEIERGVEPRQAVNMQILFSAAYRVIRLCTSVTSQFNPERVSPEKKVNLQAYLTAREMYKARTLASSKFSESEIIKLFEKNYGPRSKLIFENLKKESFGVPLSYKLKSSLASAAKQTLPDYQCLMNNLALHLVPSEVIDCPKDVGEIECGLAKKKLKSWDVDMEWTLASQRAGAEFAASKCKRMTSQEMKNLACVHARDIK
jgi:hypothetical protein